ncbi:MAG TPA: TfoX/Sxy family protein [Solirubrobacterales bacterium]|jgi:TfoX/Sxy family transcriptional regulator of competence genes|nr:TfoX/Sxy family protein [Solirubrobacterales bacterium]
MAFDEALADRIRDLLGPRADVTERRMFGGIAFMVAGNMAVGIVGDDLMVRLDPADAERALSEPHTRPMDFTGKPAKNMVFVDAEGTASDADLAGWVDAGADFAASLPPK